MVQTEAVQVESETMKRLRIFIASWNSGRTYGLLGPAMKDAINEYIDRKESHTSSRTANISHDYIQSYSGTAVSTNYKFVCWVGDENEEELINIECSNGREIIQVEINNRGNII